MSKAERGELQEDLIQYKIGKRKFVMNEMSIGTVKKLAKLIIAKVDDVRDESKEFKGVKTLSEMDIADLLEKYGNVIFGNVAEVFNYIFGHNNEGYKPVDGAWIEDNISIRIAGVIFEGVAELNRAKWLLPLLKRQFLASAYGIAPNAKLEPEKKLPKKKAS